MTDPTRSAIAERAFAEHEHRDLSAGIERIRSAAADIGSVPPGDSSIAVLNILEWVHRFLEPHAAWEDRWLYPELDRRAGSEWATKLMTFEHDQILRIARQLETDRRQVAHEHGGALVKELRRGLFSLEALLSAHIEREERFLLPLLEEDAVEGAGAGRNR